MLLSVLGQVLYRLLKRDTATRLTIDPIHQLFDRWAFRKTFQLRNEVLLERLSLARSPASEYRVRVFGQVPYQYVRHTCMTISSPSKLERYELSSAMPDDWS